MALATAPFVLKDVGLTLKKGVAAAVEYRCQLSQAQLTPAAGTSSGATMETFCATFDSSGTGYATWTLDLAGFQAFKDVTDFSVISFNDEGVTYDFVLMPIMGAVSPTNPSLLGQVKMVATAVGGTANQYAQFTASLPCLAKPLMKTA